MSHGWVRMVTTIPHQSNEEKECSIPLPIDYLAKERKKYHSMGMRLLCIMSLMIRAPLHDLHSPLSLFLSSLA